MHEKILILLTHLALGDVRQKNYNASLPFQNSFAQQIQYRSEKSLGDIDDFLAKYPQLKSYHPVINSKTGSNLSMSFLPLISFIYISEDSNSQTTLQ